MESSNKAEREAYRKAAPLETGEDEPGAPGNDDERYDVPVLAINGVPVDGVTEHDVSWLVTVLAVLTMQGDLWISPTILNAKEGGYLTPEDTDRARRLLDGMKQYAKTNAELES